MAEIDIGEIRKGEKDRIRIRGDEYGTCMYKK